ncbi:Uncharacterised protein [Mycobacteroides abscessus subsp. abscessus]|nr:Uncharacterised protein [Mycobacteroides abscessus subsp. abscessus]
MKTVQIIEHHHVKRCRGGAPILEPAYVHPIVIGMAVGKAVDQPGIAVVGEDDRLIRGEKCVKITVGQSMWMLRRRL